MLEWLKTNTAATRQKLSEEISKFKNRDFMEAVVAGCVLVANADGAVSSAEKQKMIGFMQQSDELKVFKIDDVIAFFNQLVGKFEFDPAIGKIEALKVVGKLRNNPQAARTMVRVCCVIGASDGNFDDAEKAVVAQIAIDLGLSPAEFGV